jgi:amidase
MEALKVKRLSVLELLTLDASKLQSMLSQGSITSVSLAEQVLEQITREDREGANLRAMLFVRPREMILEDAAKLDNERRHGKLRGPFHGIPIIVKAC